MDEDYFKELYERTLETGLENLTVLRLAAAWCQNTSVTKGPLGTGVVEELTGLPVTGGSLRCDYAKAPAIFGMRLEMLAVRFYEENCIGCPHRKPTEATEHLGTWADSIIAEREEERARHEEARRLAADARSHRHDDRRLLLGSPDATLQSILNLIDRIDAEERDPEAERLLLSHAEMSPGDFPDALVEHMTTEALTIGNGALLESVIAVFERQGRPSTDRMLEVAFEGVGRGVAAHAAGRVIAAHAERFDLNDQTLKGIVSLAAGYPDEIAYHWVGGEPAALLRLCDQEPDRTISFIARALRDDEVLTRATAAHAADKLAGARPTAALGLLPALLDAIQLSEKSQYVGDLFAMERAQEVVANILVVDPQMTVDQIDARMRKAEPEYARKLWGCYDYVLRSRIGAVLPRDAGEAIVRRAVALLGTDLNPELGRDVACTLELVCHDHGEELDLPLAEILQLVFRWADRLEVYEASEPKVGASASPQDGFLVFLKWDHGRSRIISVYSELERVLERWAAREPGRYIRTLTGGAWSRAERSQPVRASLLEILGSAVRDPERLDQARPILISALDGDQVGEQAAALRAIAEMGDHVVIPDELGRRVLAGLEHEKEIVVLGAIRALANVEVPAEKKRGIIVFLLNFARAYGPERIRCRDVKEALHLVLDLAKDEPYEDVAKTRALEVIASLPSAESAELLHRLPVKAHPAWTVAVAQALHVDADPNYYGIHDHLREDLLRHLADLPTERLLPLFDDLEKIAAERIPHDRTWAWAVADVLARHHQHQRAAAVCDAVVAALPDTPEQGPARRFAKQIALCHRLDAAAETGDQQAGERVLREWAQVAEEATGD